MPFRRALTLCACLLLAACSGPRETTDPTDTGPALPEPSDAPQIDHGAYEDFDEEPYREDPPGAAPEIEHDVPPELMRGRTAAAPTRSVQGYRIQVFSAPNKPDADAAVERAIAWWQSQGRAGGDGALFDGAEAPVYIAYRQPYYRVRVGNFSTRAEALRALATVRDQFPGASIVPDTVTVRE